MISIFKRSALNEKSSEVERYLLGIGILCVKHKCIKCCIETSMQLWRLDIKRIFKLGYHFRYFAVKIWEERFPSNNPGGCIFISEGGQRALPRNDEINLQMIIEMIE